MLRSLRLTSHTRSTSCRCTERWWRSAMACRSACNCLRSVSLSRDRLEGQLERQALMGFQDARVVARIVTLRPPTLHWPTWPVNPLRSRTASNCWRRWARRRARRMFGGHGSVVDGLFVALIAFDRLYLKADAPAAAAVRRGRLRALRLFRARQGRSR